MPVGRFSPAMPHIMTKVDPITATGQHTLTRVCNYVYTLDAKQKIAT